MRACIKRIAASVLCLSMLAGMTALAHRDKLILDENASPYAQGVSEEVEIDRTTYSYEYGLRDGKKVTYITNEDTSKTDVLVYNEEEGVFYLNGEVVGTAEDVSDEDIEMGQ